MLRERLALMQELWVSALWVAQFICSLYTSSSIQIQEMGTGGSSRWRRVVRHERWTGHTLVHWVSRVAADTAHTLCSMLHEALGKRVLFSLSSSGLTFSFLLCLSLPCFFFPAFFSFIQI